MLRGPFPSPWVLQRAIPESMKSPSNSKLWHWWISGTDFRSTKGVVSESRADVLTDNWATDLATELPTCFLIELSNISAALSLVKMVTRGSLLADTNSAIADFSKCPSADTGRSVNFWQHMNRVIVSFNCHSLKNQPKYDNFSASFFSKTSAGLLTSLAKWNNFATFGFEVW